jgi:hypothetical protein
MKRRFIMLVIIGAMVVITWQHGKNRALTQLLEKSKNSNVMHIDEVFDLQQENGTLMEEVMSLQTDNAILGSCCANGGLDADTLDLK